MKTFILPLLMMVGLPSAWARSKILNHVLQRAATSDRMGAIPVVVMDLDETLIDSTLRRFEAYQDSVRTLCGKDRTGDCGKSAGLNISEFLSLPNRYDQNPLFDQVGISKGAWSAQLNDSAIKIYLSGKWIELDQATPGATEYIQELRKLHAKIFFVTSRWKTSQGAATLASLQHLGMWSEDDHDDSLILRPAGMSSIDFKRISYKMINDWREAHDALIVGAFENEPENMNAMVDAFPGATHVFVTGAFIQNEPLKGAPGLIKTFR